MITKIQETELYKKFKEALNIRNDMRPDDNPFVVKCCEIAEDYRKQHTQNISNNDSSLENFRLWIAFNFSSHSQIVEQLIKSYNRQ